MAETNVDTVINTVSSSQDTVPPIVDTNRPMEAADSVSREIEPADSVGGFIGPWRKTVNLEDREEVRDKLLKEITDYYPLGGLFPPDVVFPHVNILLLGAVGAGKSSTYNTIISMFMNKIWRPAASGSSNNSLTNKVTKYPTRTRNKLLHFNFWDMRGLEERHFMSKENMKYILAGNVPDKYPLDPSGEISRGSPGFQQSPQVFETIHCVAVVIDSSIVDTWEPSANIVRNIKELLTVMNGLDVPVVGVLTKIDSLCSYTHSDVTNVFNSQSVAKAVDKVSYVLGLPRHSIYPLKNYEEETELDTNVDIVALLMLKGILDHCDAFLVNRYKNIVDKASVDAAIKEENARLKEENEILRNTAATIEIERKKNIEEFDQLELELSGLVQPSYVPDCSVLQSEIMRLNDQRAALEKEINELREAIKSKQLNEEEESRKQAESQASNESQTVDAGHAVADSIVLDESCTPITVQIYSAKSQLLAGVEDELTPQLTARLKSIDCDVVFNHISNIDDVVQDYPMLILCAVSSRLGTDVDDAIKGLDLNKRTVLLAFHHKDTGALPQQSSERVLTGVHLKQLGGILDIAYLTDKGIYPCDMNTTSLDKIVSFIKEMTITT